MSWTKARIAVRRCLTVFAFAGLVLGGTRAQAQVQPPAQAARRPLPSIEEKTEGMRKLDGWFPLYWDSAAGQLWMEIPRFGTEVLYARGLASGPEFWARVDALGSRQYYAPVDMKGMPA